MQYYGSISLHLAEAVLLVTQKERFLMLILIISQKCTSKVTQLKSEDTVHYNMMRSIPHINPNPKKKKKKKKKMKGRIRQTDKTRGETSLVSTTIYTRAGVRTLAVPHNRESPLSIDIHRVKRDLDKTHRCIPKHLTHGSMGKVLLLLLLLGGGKEHLCTFMWAVVCMKLLT